MRTRTTREKQREYLQLWEESNLSQRSFCKKMGISLTQFAYWRHVALSSQREEVDIDIHPGRILPVSITEPTCQPCQPHESLVVHTKKAVLEIPPGFPHGDVCNVIKALQL